MNFINQLLENFKKEKCILHLQTIFGVLTNIDLVNTIKELSIYYVQSICLVNMHGLFLWKIRKGTSIVNALKKIISKGRKRNTIWVDQGSEFYNQSFKDFLKISNIEMYWKFNEGKSVVAERFIRTLKNKIFQHMTAISKNVYFDVLDDIVNKYNNTVHRTIKMKPINVTDDSFVEYNEESNKKDPKFKIGDHVKISKWKNIFAKGYSPNSSK